MPGLFILTMEAEQVDKEQEILQSIALVESRINELLSKVSSLKEQHKQLREVKLKEVTPNVNQVTPVIQVTPPETVTEQPYIKPMELYLGKYEKENTTYQLVLDKEYGTVKPIERYISPRATILHYCSNCEKEWYAKPIWLLTKENQRHICGVDLAKLGDPKKSKRVAITDEIKLKMCVMAEQGMSKSKIASSLGISRPTVINYLKKAGL